MQQPLQITFRGMEPSEAVSDRIRSEAAKLERFSDRITRCHVTVEVPHAHHHKGNLFAVHIDLSLPGKEIVVGHSQDDQHAHEDAYVAIRDAFERALRQLEDFVRKRDDARRRS